MSQGISLGQIPYHASTGSATTRGAVKLHVGLEHEGLLPAFVALTEGKTHDLTAARALRLPKGSIVVMDRGYNDDAWYKQLNNNDISFVTRLKINSRYRVIASAGSATVSADMKLLILVVLQPDKT